MTTLKIFKTHPEVQLPKFATKQSACFDISYQAWGKGSYKGYNKVNANFERQIGSGAEGVITITPGDRVMIPTGMILDIPEGYSVRLHPRSGLPLQYTFGDPVINVCGDGQVGCGIHKSPILDTAGIRCILLYL